MTSDKSRNAISDFVASCHSMPERDRRNARRANWLLFFWAVTFLPALYLFRRGLMPSGPISWVAVVVPIVLAIAGVVAYIKFLREADELQRQIQLEALSVGFGAGFVASFGLQLLEELGLGDYGAPDTFSVMVFFYLAGMLIGSRRYR